MVSPKTQPPAQQHTIGRDRTSPAPLPEEAGRHPYFWDFHKEDKPPKHLAWKNNEADVQETQGAIGN